MSKPKIIYEAECPNCGKTIEFENIGWKICPHCKRIKAKFGVSFEVLEEIEDE